MLEKESEIFTKFADLSRNYIEGSDNKKFHEVGEQILEIINSYEQILCGVSDRAGKGKFTNILSMKFWNKIRENFPMVVQIGIL